MAMDLPFASVLTWIGLITVACVIFGVIDFVAPFFKPSQINRFLHTAKPEPNNKSPFHPWAIVTGTTSGLGLSLAHELASNGFNVVLHGRNPTKLNAVQKSLQEAFPDRRFRTLPVDATTCVQSPDIFKDIVARLSDIHLTVLVNNAGGANSLGVIPTPSNPFPYTPLQAHTHATISSTIALNLTFPIMLTSALLPVLAHRNQGPALIISIGSIGDAGFPLLSVYAGTKAALRTTFDALAREINFPPPPASIIASAPNPSPRGNILIHHMRIGEVTNTSHNQSAPNLFLLHSSTAAKAIIARVGCGRTVIEPHWTMRLTSLMPDWFPWWIKEPIFRMTMVDMRDQAARAAGRHE